MSLLIDYNRSDIKTCLKPISFTWPHCRRKSSKGKRKQSKSCFTNRTSSQTGVGPTMVVGVVIDVINTLNVLNTEMRDEEAPEVSEMYELLEKKNKEWNECFADELETKRNRIVSFNEDRNSHIVLEEEDRKAEWVQAALDRVRFNKRCKDLEHIIAPVFLSDHREKVYNLHHC